MRQHNNHDVVIYIKYWGHIILSAIFLLAWSSFMFFGIVTGERVAWIAATYLLIVQVYVIYKTFKIQGEFTTPYIVA